MISQVRDRLAEAGVRLDAMLLDLGREPRLQVVHERPAVRDVKRELFVRAEALRSRVGIVTIDLAERLSVNRVVASVPLFAARRTDNLPSPPPVGKDHEIAPPPLEISEP